MKAKGRRRAATNRTLFHELIRDHLNADPTKLKVVSERIPALEHPNVHLAIEAYLSEQSREARIVGVTAPEPKQKNTLAQLASPPHRSCVHTAVEYRNITLGEGRVLACVEQGLYLIRDGDQRLVALLRRERDMFEDAVVLEVVSCTPPLSERFLAEVRHLMRKENIYRGRVISLSCQHRLMGPSVQFPSLAPVRREDIILPPGLLERVERLTIGFCRARDRLRKAQRHLKHGLLLHGQPGTGKTMVATYLASRMEGRTVLLLAGEGLGLIEQSCAMARALQPATVILEDVDLVAEDRSHRSCNALLFELLNQMDGLAEDMDVLFLLTSNRADLLEPALALRPGRIDQAIEIPRPDAGCRRRLFARYARGLNLRCRDLDRFVARTDGVTAAFIRELLRRAALFAVDDGEEIVIEDRHLDQALQELLVGGGALTRTLLGADRPRGTTDTDQPPESAHPLADAVRGRSQACC